MRQPSDLYEAFAWWRDALNGKAPAIHPAEPHCGFFTRRMVRNGPAVPVAIWIEQEIDEAGELVSDERMVCLVGDREEDPATQWTYCAGNPIPEAEYRYLLAMREWASEHAPHHPAAQPFKPIDPLSVGPVF